MHGKNMNGVMVVSRDEGAYLGTVSSLFIDPDTRRLASIGFRRHRWTTEQIVDAAQLVSIGKDVVFLTAEAAVRTPTDEDREKRSLHEMKGLWVTTAGGDHVGVLEDVELESGDWHISELHLRDGRVLELGGIEDAVIGHDEILLSSAVKQAMPRGTRPKRGFLGRLFGRAAAEEPAAISNLDESRVEPSEMEHQDTRPHH
jgi:uncharacterized protein YrrD